MNKSDLKRDHYMLKGPLAKQGYDWWWHSFTAYNKETGEPRPFFIEYFVCNPDLAEDEPTLGQDPKNIEAGKRPSYCMLKVGAYGKDPKQIHNFYSMKDFECPDDRLDIKIGEYSLTETHMTGYCKVTEDEARDHPEYMSDAGEMKWDLDIDKQITFNVGYGANSFFRKINAFEMFWHAEGIKTQYSGTVELDGVEYEVIPEKSFGYADKNWGRDFTSPWVWLSSNNLTSKITGKKLEDSVFDIGGGCPKVGPVALKRKLLSAYWHEGKCYEFNFSKFWTYTRTKFDCQETDEQIIWHVEQKTWNNRMVTDITCEKKDMLLVSLSMVRLHS